MRQMIISFLIMFLACNAVAAEPEKPRPVQTASPGNKISLLGTKVLVDGGDGGHYLQIVCAGGYKYLLGSTNTSDGGLNLVQMHKTVYVKNIPYEADIECQEP